ncbi:inactive serine/threonine-protein kinase BKN1-like [Bidens hawaiensis]|uniref:inactive serine/threonine-protein kinase BKN1-like n=1 Tax=Bidens hawaiensis TaxID=980011 RepID=UPI00404966A0
MEKRSLKDYLQEGIETIPFMTRVKIAVGVARGLHFLQSNQLIVEGWILDTDEIWLDKEFNAKLFYFDVAMLLYRLRYPLAGHTSKRRQCDVNGLGMLLMEILRGKPFVLDYLGREHWSGEVALASNTRIEDLVDPRMILNDNDNERAHELLSLILKCTRHDYAMEQVLRELEQIYSRMRDGEKA